MNRIFFTSSQKSAYHNMPPKTSGSKKSTKTPAKAQVKISASKLQQKAAGYTLAAANALSRMEKLKL